MDIADAMSLFLRQMQWIERNMIFWAIHLVVNGYSIVVGISVGSTALVRAEVCMECFVHFAHFCAINCIAIFFFVSYEHNVRIIHCYFHTLRLQWNTFSVAVSHTDGKIYSSERPSLCCSLLIGMWIHYFPCFGSSILFLTSTICTIVWIMNEAI